MNVHVSALAYTDLYIYICIPMYAYVYVYKRILLKLIDPNLDMGGLRPGWVQHRPGVN